MLQEAETMVISKENPIVPIFFYVGFNYFDTNKIKGVYPNILDIHPLNNIWRAEPAKTAAIAKNN
jgi:oligopeptide transport system substrate-binding protein